MPADRSKDARRLESDVTQFQWSPPAESLSSPSGVSLAPNFTFSDSPPPLVDPPSHEFVLFPPPGDAPLAPKRQPHSKKKPDNHIPRPPNAFILFRSSFIKSQHVSTEVETNHSTLSKIIGLTWQNLSEKERQVWHAKAKAALEEHKRKFPQYAFRPTQSKKGGGGGGGGSGTTPEKRKVREVEPKDLKRCAKIAEYLAAGLKGQELDAAMQEFDKHHVPEIVTRFETPITAKTYRRSSSAPIPDTENSKANQSFFATITKGRALSSQPTRCSTPNVTYPCAAQNILKQEPSLDFSSFSFHHSAVPFSASTCSPLSGIDPSSSPIEPLTPAQDIFPAHLHIDTLAPFVGDWNSISPIPADTPQLSPASSYESLTAFTAGNFDKSLPEYPLPSYHPYGLDMGDYINGAATYAPFTQSNEGQLSHSHLNLDFSSLSNFETNPYTL